MWRKVVMAMLALSMALSCGCGSPSETETELSATETETKKAETEAVETETEKENDGEAKIYPEGLDVRLAGVLDNSLRDRYIKVEQDAYVVNGVNSDNDSLNTVFGKSDRLEMKSSKSKKLHRVSYLKFDISDLTNPNVTSVQLRLKCISAEVDTGVELYIYETSSDSWNESTLTYGNRPSRGKLIASHAAVVQGLVTIDLTDYVREALANGKSKISIMLEGADSGTARKLTFDSKESTTGTAPILYVQYGVGFTTELDFIPTIINPWSYAMECVNTFLDRWFTSVDSLGSTGAVQQIPEDPKEYKTTVGAARHYDTNGAATQYTNYPSRNMDTLIGYTYNQNEKDLYDVYGGYMGGERYEVTGFFYTKKVGDRWWVIDPLGYPHYRVGMNAVSVKSSVADLYGSNEKFALSQTRHLMDDLGFNSSGGWSTIEELSLIEKPLSQTMILNLMIDYTTKLGLNVSEAGNTDLANGIIPVFDPDFVDFCQTTVQTKVAPYVDDPNVFGWMLDNELPGGETMLDSCLTLDYNNPQNFYSYATAWTFMYLMNGKNPNVSINDVTDELRELFRAMVWDRYYEVTTTAVREVDSNHMILGSRFYNGTWSVECILKACAYWCDVLTANVYGQWTPSSEWIANVEKWTDAPFIVTEWYAKGMDVANAATSLTNKEGAGFTVKTQKDRGLFYQNFALKLLEAKNCVGFDWFKYWDDDPGSNAGNPNANFSNKGIYSAKHEEYTDLTSMMKKLNFNKYSLIEFFDERS